MRGLPLFFFSEKKRGRKLGRMKIQAAGEERRMRRIAVTRTPPPETTSDPKRRRAEHIITPYVGKEGWGGEGGQWGQVAGRSNALHLRAARSCPPTEELYRDRQVLHVPLWGGGGGGGGHGRLKGV